jgi:transposase
MAWHIYPRELKGHTYYYAQRSFREKPAATKTGKRGASKFRTEMLYLGTAEAIVDRFTASRAPIETRHREFGFSAAIYETAREIGLVELLKAHMPGVRFGVARWLYFMLPIINRLQCATSKEQMGKWAKGTVLPDLLDFDPARLHSKSFWYATDDVISEKELRERRKEHPELEDELFVGLDDALFARIEEALMTRLREQFGLFANTLLYDTTNFFTYIQAPVRAKLANTGHNKDAHHHLRQVGLALCVDKEWGIPLFYRLYRGNAQDARSFAEVLDELVRAVTGGFDSIEELVLVLDKGNNSQKNFEALQGKLRWVGSLVPTHHKDLLALPLSDYEGCLGDCRYHRLTRKVMGIECTLVLTYNAKLARKQQHSLDNGIEKLQQQIRQKWTEYKKAPASIPAGIETMKKNSRYGNYLEVSCEEGQVRFTQTPETADRIALQQRRFGKNLLFANGTGAEASWIITQYHSKDRVEDGFKLLKLPELIRWRPCRHWTDTKIRAFGFCCIMALILIRVMERKTALAGLPMSPALIKEELCDLREVLILCDDKTIQTQVTARSAVQQRLWDLFGLGLAEEQLIRHNRFS